MAAIMRGRLLLAVRSPSIPTALTGQGVKVGFVSTSRIATRKLSLWPFTGTSIQASTKENSTTTNESNTPIKAATKDNSTHRLRVKALNSVPKEYTIKIDLFDDKPALELVYRDDQIEFRVIDDFMEKHGMLKSGRLGTSDAEGKIRDGMYDILMEQTGGRVSRVGVESGVVTPEQATRAGELKPTESPSRNDDDAAVGCATSPDQPRRFHAEARVSFNSVVNERTRRKLLETVRERLATVVLDHGYSSQFSPLALDVTSFSAGFVELDLISRATPASPYHYRLSFTPISVSEEEIVRIKKELEGIPQIDSIKIRPRYSDAELEDMDRQKLKKELMYRDDQPAQEPHCRHDIMLDGKASSISALTIGISASIMLCLWAYGSDPAHEKYHDHLIILEKGLDDSHVANVKREINMIANEGRIDAKSAVEEYSALSHHIFWTRLQPAQTHIIEKIRALKDVKSVTACKKADNADVKAGSAIDQDDQPLPEVYLRYHIMLEKGLDDSQVANVEREINKIVEEERGGEAQGTASMAAIEGLIQYTYVILLARFRPDQARVLERIRGLTEFGVGGAILLHRLSLNAGLVTENAGLMV
ncbi:hypothetical protein LTS10_004761 [Elasticomyces elasticus]|nr:hypothetical protein LTS10_004761 [Elasticomyces elasticus]